MPTQLEKTAAFLKKMAAEGVLNKGLWGPDAPFQQPAPAPSADELATKLNDLSASPDTDQRALAENVQKGVLAKGTDSDAARSAAGGLLGIKKEAPGFLSNVGAGLARGHVGTVAATGAAALLAGVLTYNMLKKKSKGNVTQMPLRKAAQTAPAAGMFAKIKDAAKGAYGKAKGVVEKNPKTTAATLGAAGGAAVTQGVNSAVGGEKNLAEKAGLPASFTTGSTGGDLAVAGGAAALGTLGLIALYKKLRGQSA